MRLPGLFELTNREQRVVVLIVMVFLAAAIAKHYRDARATLTPAKSISVETNFTTSPTPGEYPDNEPDK